jgi:hypothetical protein
MYLSALRKAIAEKETIRVIAEMVGKAIDTKIFRQRDRKRTVRSEEDGSRAIHCNAELHSGKP